MHAPCTHCMHAFFHEGCKQCKHGACMHKAAIIEESTRVGAV